MTWTLGQTQIGNLTYRYDADGRVVERAGSLAQTLTPNAVSGDQFNGGNEMTAFGRQTLSYDANGNLTADANNAYTWDARNHLTTITGILPSTTSACFEYDALGRRVQKTINGTSTALLYDGLNPVQELTPAALGQYVVNANNLTGLGIDEYFQRTDSVNGPQTFISDFLNTTIALTNSSGSVTTSYSYEPFGNVSVSNPSLTDPNPFQFTGRENDALGLNFYRARYYYPGMQRFVSQDPL
jgi:YD repeat-containing protein